MDNETKVSDDGMSPEAQHDLDSIESLIARAAFIRGYRRGEASISKSHLSAEDARSLFDALDHLRHIGVPLETRDRYFKAYKLIEEVADRKAGPR